MIRRSWGQSRLNCRKTCRATDSSGSCVLPARKTMSSVRQSGQCGQATRGGIVAIGLGAIVLHGTGDLDCFRPGPQDAESLGIGRILHGDAIDAPKQPGNKRPDAAITFETPLAQPAVDDRGSRTVTPGSPNQVRPKFQFGQYQHVGPDPPHGRIHGPGKIQRTIENGPAGIFLLGQRHAGLGGRGNDTSQSGRSRSIKRSSGASRLTSPTLTACSQMHFLFDVRRGDQAEQFLGIAFAVLARTDGRPEQPGRSGKSRSR